MASVRTEKTGSQGSSGRVGESRVVSNHGGEVVSGVYKILQETTGNGRFLENLPSDEVPMYLVMDRENNTLTNQINALNLKFSGIDTIIALDTGGDALYPVKRDGGLPNSARATPDQDLRVLNAIGFTKVTNKISAIVSAGIDSPKNAEAILEMAGAKYFQLNSKESNQVMSRYTKWEMTGTNDARFGKTALTWQKALRGEFGFHALPIPVRVVIDANHPWYPFVHIDESMAGIFFMNIQDHLYAILK